MYQKFNRQNQPLSIGTSEKQMPYSLAGTGLFQRNFLVKPVSKLTRPLTCMTGVNSSVVLILENFPKQA